MRHPLTVWTLAITICAPAVAAMPEEPPRLTVESLFATDATGRTAQHAWSPDGTRLTYVWKEGEEKEALWSLDPATGRREVLLRETEDFKLDKYSWSPCGDALLVVSKGDLYLFPLDTRKLRRLTRTEAGEEDPSFSPDGSRIAFVRGFDLYAIDVATDRETRLTTVLRPSLSRRGEQGGAGGKAGEVRAPAARPESRSPVAAGAG